MNDILDLTEEVPTGTSNDAQTLALVYRSLMVNIVFTSMFCTRHYRENIAKKFYEHRSEWLERARHNSTMQLATRDRAYRSIVAMGMPVVPFLIRDLQSTGTHWFLALTAITGENPIKPEHAGNIPQMIKDWADWSAERHLA